jgi:hypothetical protein
MASFHVIPPLSEKDSRRPRLGGVEGITAFAIVLFLADSGGFIPEKQS